MHLWKQIKYYMKNEILYIYVELHLNKTLQEKCNSTAKKKKKKVTSVIMTNNSKKNTGLSYVGQHIFPHIFHISTLCRLHSL